MEAGRLEIMGMSNQQAIQALSQIEEVMANYESGKITLDFAEWKICQIVAKVSG
jgi:hypothetical protein